MRIIIEDTAATIEPAQAEQPLNAPDDWQFIVYEMCKRCTGGQVLDIRKCKDAGCPLHQWRVK